MPLNRITLATDTLLDFIALPPAQQKILIFLLSNRNMRERPTRPTRYFAHQDIADETGLKPTTVRLSIMALTKEGWLTRLNQRQKFTPTGEAENQFKWCITKVVEELKEAFEAEAEAEAEVAAQAHLDNLDADHIFLHEERLWRVGGVLGWQVKKKGAINSSWIDTANAPDEVSGYFFLKD